MDTSDVEITFNQDGICNHCIAYSTSTENAFGIVNNEKALIEILTNIKKEAKGAAYDCIAGISGGVDSTYVLFLLKKYNLNPLVVHLDNGWNSELASINIENAIKTLGFDLYTKVLDWKEFKELQVAYLKASVIDLEALTDHAITATLYELATKFNVKWIIGGTNTNSEAILPSSWRYPNKTSDSINIKAINKKFRGKPIKHFPLFSFLDFVYQTSVKKVKWFSILNYVNYNKEEAKKIVIKELNWRDYGGKHYESIITRFYQGYILPKKFGIDKRRAHLATLINSGQIKREEALEILNQPPLPEYIFKQDLVYVPKKLGISQTEFAHLMEQPIKSHFSYSNDLWLRNFIFGLNKIISKIKRC